MITKCRNNGGGYKKKDKIYYILSLSSGEYRIRTGGLLTASQAL